VRPCVALSFVACGVAVCGCDVAFACVAVSVVCASVWLCVALFLSPCVSLSVSVCLSVSVRVSVCVSVSQSPCLCAGVPVVSRRAAPTCAHVSTRRVLCRGRAVGDAKTVSLRSKSRIRALTACYEAAAVIGVHLIVVCVCVCVCRTLSELPSEPKRAVMVARKLATSDNIKSIAAMKHVAGIILLPNPVVRVVHSHLILCVYCCRCCRC
jgi:hypothetical protein